MNLKIDKELFNEKVYGGFEPTDPDDETFLLNKLGKYPGELPYKIESTQSETTFLNHLDTSEEPITNGEAPITSENVVTQQEQTQPESFDTFDQIAQEETERFQPIESEVGIEKDERRPIPYKKAGIEKEEREPIPYKKSGLLEDEDPIPFQRSQNLIKKAKALESEEKDSPGSIWDIFQEGETTTTDTTEQSAKDQVIKTFEQATIETSESEEPKGTKTQTILIESDSIVDIPFEIKIEEISQEELSKIFDDDFRKTILDDLEKSQKRREERQKHEEIITTREKEDLQKELNQLEQVQTQSLEEVEIDISSIEIEKPSQIIAKELQETDELKKGEKRKKEKKAKSQKEKTQEEIKQEAEVQPSVVEFEKETTKEQEEEKPIEEKPEDEKKRRKVPILWLGVASALVLILFAIGGYLLYQNLFVPKEKPKETAKKEEVFQKATPEKPFEQKIEKPQPNATEKQPTLAVENKPDSKIEQNVPAKEVKTLEQKIAEKKEPEQQIAPAKPTEKKEPIPTKVEKEVKPIIAKKETEPTTKPTQRQLKIPQEVKIVETPQEEYSIEILSTADPEEAGYWLNHLQQRGINAYQKIHRIRNVPYYKIRIGTYKTIEEAKGVARALGFKNVWIDRIK